MKEKNQPMQQETNQLQSKYRSWIVLYLDILIRSLMSFVIVGILLTIALLKFHFPFLWILIIAFCISILISPLFMKIKLGDKFLTWYENFLHERFVKK